MSHKCYAISLKGKPSPFKKPRLKICEQCGEEYFLKKRGITWDKQKHCSRKCMHLSQQGENNPFFGRTHSEAVLQKNKETHIGKTAWNKGLCGFGWKGGKKAARVRHKAKRRALDFIPLNNCKVDGWVGHHIDKKYVIYIPEVLHKSVAHSVLRDKNMDIINKKVFMWLKEEYSSLTATAD